MLHLFKLYNNALYITGYYEYTIGADTKDLGFPYWINDVKDAGDKVVHIICSISLEH